jgi:hypothetical protein
LQSVIGGIVKTVTIKGGTANLREGHEIKIRHRRLVESAAVAASSALAKLPPDVGSLDDPMALSELDLSEAEATSLFRLQDATIVATLESWTLSDPIPDMDTIGDMDPDAYEKLAEETRSVGASVVSTNFDPGDPSSPEFESSPTTPSGVSEDDSRADQEQESTRTPNTDGPSTSSVSPSQD